MYQPASIDVCDLDLIYNDTYSYSLPRPVLESYLSGKAFDNLTPYTEQESENVQNDIRDIYRTILDENPSKGNLAIITAGAPGAGKTTLLQQDREQNLKRGDCYAYICPDDVCLPNQTRTYIADIESNDPTETAKQNAYTKWRPASNAATHLILGNLIREKYSFYFGTTSSGKATKNFFAFLKERGYKIRLLHISCSDDVRWKSVENHMLLHTTEQDVREKGELLPQRINDTFLAYADGIEFYCRDDVQENATLAAIWLRNEPTANRLGTLHILSSDRYEKIKQIHNATIKKLNLKDLSWESTVEKNSKILS